VYEQYMSDGATVASDSVVRHDAKGPR
jgi:hypothetical protein